MPDYTFYDKTTGEILKIATCSKGAMEYELTQNTNTEVILGHYSDALYYIVSGAVEPRPSMDLSVDKTTITADGTDEATITNIPSGATATCEGESLTIDDGELVFTADTVGTYTITFECWPYLDEEVTINAT